ncbi:D-lactate dehydrogenase (cytochrome)/glycolate oxidase [Rhodococcus wratislaviensis]|uniref:D-lactate dehydrogenase (Cytochrome) n=1 Tax=Rhodococcus wratislaviensis TaxID=44752 RepID=A0AB38FD20_RHOWR|nr:FAD-linked oxidase C-terminal domain-containing protein [Rhodococcus wratislaviensis]REE75581.1 D-lactate dehydrogenase (cytochrome)/glycolate oxidase [Rhodococcus wratislaviensis]SPZ39383.1 D-lactate dehydrogenase (cytochrome) [Rhodococcus wratislaviensis]
MSLDVLTPVSELTAALGDAVVTEPDLMLAYRRDQSLLTAAGMPLALVRARDTDDVVAALKIAHRHGVPVVTRGAGTGLAGAANALDGCIVLSMEKMNAVLDIDPAARTATVQPGVINGDLAAAAAEHGLWYVPDPGSRAISSIGGNLATNAGGTCCAKYGVTGDHVARIKAVLADGRIIHTGATTRKNVAGLNLTQLLVGSEGTLAVIVEATMRLRAAPTAAATVVASFPETAQAIEAVLAIRQVAEPCLAELMDRTTIAAVNDMTHMGLDESAGALLLIQCDGRDSTAEARICAQACADAGATEVYDTDDPVEGEAFMQARRVALTALERRGSTLLDDLSVPVHRLPEMLQAIEGIATRYDLTIGTFGHAADGNLHPTIVFDASDSEQSARALQSFDEMVVECLALGGSISGEHGIGVLKEPYMEAMVGATERELMARVKEAFDPTGILNPGRGL